MKIAVDELRQKMIATFTAKDFNADDAGRIVEVLIWAEMSGIAPMGITKLIGTEPIQDQVANATVEIIHDTKLSRLINAHGAPAPLVCQQATDVVISKAKDHGFGLVGVNNTSYIKNTPAIC